MDDHFLEQSMEMTVSSPALEMDIKTTKVEV